MSAVKKIIIEIIMPINEYPRRQRILLVLGIILVLLACEKGPVNRLIEAFGTANHYTIPGCHAPKTGVAVGAA